ncbi:MAG: PAS domain S-box protein [Daejeonella sp.]
MKIIPDGIETFLQLAPPTLIIQPDSEFTILYANSAFYSVTGSKPLDLIGKSFIEAFPENPDNLESGNFKIVRKSFEECINNKIQTDLPTQKYDIPVRGTGMFETRYWQALNTPVLTREGAVEYIVHVTIDITGVFELAKKEHRAFEVAEAKRHELHTLLMEAPGAICILEGPQFVFELVNPTYQSIFPGRELLKKPLIEALPELAGHPLIDVLKNVYASGETFEGKEVLTRIARQENSSTEDIYWTFIYKARYDLENNIDGILVFGFEVTQQVLSKKKIQESQERLNLAVEYTDAGVFDTDLVTEKTIRSLKHAHIYGYPDNSGEWTLDMVRNHILPQDKEEANEAYLKSFQTGILNHSFRIKRDDGSIRWVNTTGKIVFNETHEPVRIIGTVTDITERKELERQKDEFISTVSHELKTPVTSIKAYAQLLHRELGAKESFRVGNFLDRMGIQINRLELLIRDLLDITRVDSGKLEFSESVFNLNEIISDVIGDLQLITPAHNLIIRENPHISLKTDKHRIIQVITNLVNNAVTYSPAADNVYISIVDNKDFVVFSVEDFGVGIPEAHVPLIFNRFHQAKNTNEGAGLNLGLGLYI